MSTRAVTKGTDFLHSGSFTSVNTFSKTKNIAALGSLENYKAKTSPQVEGLNWC